MSTPRAYYNEFDKNAAAWLRELIAQGHIADGDVDERSIVDVRGEDLRGYTQCHFFAGIGVWSYALRLAGWPDDQPVWTGSCPCQPFSAAGRKSGFDDARHLWPYWNCLIAECGPPVVFGEQVASPDGLKWLDAVSFDLESQDYAVGAADLCAAGVGAPHIRQRLWFVADADDERSQGWRREELRERADQCVVGAGGAFGGVADTPIEGSPQWRPGTVQGVQKPERSPIELERCSDVGRTRPGPTNGHWRDVDWLLCRDGKWRPVEPGTFPLAHGAAARVGRLRGYGNAIVAPVAAEVIGAYMDVRELR